MADDLVLSSRIPCGKEKCFYTSKTSPNEGYLIARTSRSHASEKYERLVEGWQLATRLEREYHIPHFLVSPPTIVPVSDHLAALLNENLWYETQDLPVDQVGNKKKPKDRFPPFSQAYVQKVQVAPTPNLLLACAPSNRPHFERHLHQFLLNVHPTKFMTNFSKNLNKTRELLTTEPCLMKDFQVLMDPEGDIYHLDFDRCFQTRQVDETQTCLDYLNEVERYMSDILQDPFQASNIRSTDQVPCGQEKCLFRTKSNASIGYLVARSSDKDNRKARFESLQAAYALAQNLTTFHHIQHFLMAPPAQITMTRALATRLNPKLVE